mmetsp:Transcript_1010/g.2067  ORF Transcript_1010/g.2067 Transcript_1010/m.2067 type:complete len:109 (-) Transcript_1010:264-590(-)
MCAVTCFAYNISGCNYRSVQRPSKQKDTSDSYRDVVEDSKKTNGPKSWISINAGQRDDGSCRVVSYRILSDHLREDSSFDRCTVFCLWYLDVSLSLRISPTHCSEYEQ